MKANEAYLDEFLTANKTRFVIPVYQRNYDWTRDQCQQLFIDIVKVGQGNKAASHFIGSIVHIQEELSTATGITERVIIDGQQRLTTITLIYLAIYRLALTVGDQRLADEIYETYLINKYAANDNEKHKLKLAENNDIAYQFLLSGNEVENFREYSRLIDNFNFFNKNITEENYLSVLHGLRKLIFVEVALDRDKDNPQRIFESLNSTGLDLSQADLIRNYVLMGLRTSEQNRLYKNYWVPIESKAKDERSNISRVSDFIRDYLTLKTKKIPKKENVYLEFKNRYAIDNSESIEVVLRELKDLSEHYNKLVNPTKEKSLSVREQLDYIQRLEINVAYPFLLQVYDDYKKQTIDENTFVQVLALIQNYVWRRFISGLPSNSLNKTFMNLYEKIDIDNYLESLQLALLQRAGTQRFPHDSEVIDALKTKNVYNIQNKNRVYFLERLEHHNNNERIQILGNPLIQTEHIFPQTPDSTWKADLPDEDYKAFSNTYLHTIANLTLSGNNGKLGNKGFVAKRDLKGAGYRDSSLWLNKYLANIDKWDIKELKRRFAVIEERFLEIWPFPEVELSVQAESEELNIFDAEEPRNKALEYVIFQNQKLEFGSITEFYLYVLAALFEQQPSAFYSSGLFQRVGLTRGESTANKSLTKAGAISDAYFVETNMSSNNKFERLKDALEIFGMEEELSIKYKD